MFKIGNCLVFNENKESIAVQTPIEEFERMENAVFADLIGVKTCDHFG